MCLFEFIRVHGGVGVMFTKHLKEGTSCKSLGTSDTGKLKGPERNVAKGEKT
jgi:hypothetical protein